MKVLGTNGAHTRPRAAALRSNGSTHAAILGKLRLDRTSTSSAANLQSCRYAGGDVVSHSFPTRSRAWSLRTNIPPFGLSARANSTLERLRRQVPCAWPQWPPSLACNRQCGADCLRSTRSPHGHSSSRRAADDRLCLVGRLRDPLGRARRVRCARKGRRLHPRAGLLTTHGDQSFGFAAFSVGRREKHLNANRCQPSDPDVAIGGHDHLLMQRIE